MKILHIASGDLWAGAEAMLFSLVKAQRELAGVQVAAILFNEGSLAQGLRHAGVETMIIPEDAHGTFRLVLKSAHTIKRFAPDIVHTHRIKEDIVGALASALTRVGLCVRTVHGQDEARGTSTWLALRQLLHGKCVRHGFAMTVTVSRALEAQNARRLGSSRVRHVPNGIDVAATERFSSPRALDDAAVRVGLIGRLVPIKRADIFLLTAALLNKDSSRHFQFLVYGEGPERDNLLELSAQLGLHHAVQFCGFESKILERMNSLDVLCLTSDSEGLPMVVLEAMALGVPVVSHAVGDIPEVLGYGTCGTLVETQEPAAFAQSIRGVIECPDGTADKLKRARERVQTHYSAEACARSYIHVYTESLRAADRS